VSAIDELLERKVAAPVYETDNTVVEIRHADHVTLSRSAKADTNFTDKRRSLGRYTSLADSDHGVFFLYFLIYIYDLFNVSVMNSVMN
jgi:hypothetical protein